MSNNISETSSRTGNVARKDWLFSETPDGAHANTIYLSIIEMAKDYNLNIYEYIKYMLEQRPNEHMSDEKLDQLAPWSESVQQLCTNVNKIDTNSES